jgi:hypothetical protein
MKTAWRWLAIMFVAGALAIPGMNIGQTPDGETPAEEESCTKYEGEGARFGLCVAYCEAQDCEGMKLDPISCRNIEQNFIDWSVKKGYVKGKKPQPIDCSVTACSADDVRYCRGVEQDCIDPETGDCESVCTSEFAGFDGKGNPLCTAIPPCKKCVGDNPKN